jgi:hypothetical protein
VSIVWRGAYAVRQMVGDIWWPNHDVCRYHSLNLIVSVDTVKRSHDASRSLCRPLEPWIRPET